MIDAWSGVYGFGPDKNRGVSGVGRVRRERVERGALQSMENLRQDSVPFPPTRELANAADTKGVRSDSITTGTCDESENTTSVKDLNTQH